MNKTKKIILVILGLIIITLIVGLIIVNDKPKVVNITEKEFINNYNKLNKNNNKVYPIKNHLYKKEKKKDIYLFDNKFYLVIGRDNEKLEKVYLYTGKENEYEDYLLNVIKSMNSKLDDREAKKIFDRLTDIENKKADELGFIVNFEEDGYNYMTIQRDDGKTLSFFIYQPRQ